MQIATIGYTSDGNEYSPPISTRNLVVLTENGEIYTRELGLRGSKWELIQGPTPGRNISDRVPWEDDEPL